MKLCEKCGTPQKDDNFRCIECGAILPEPLSEKEQEIIEDKISDYIEEKVETTDDFYVNKFDKAMAILDGIGIVVSALILFLRRPIGEHEAVCFLSILLFAIAGVEALFPKLSWFFEEMRVKMRYHVEKLHPSDTYLIVRKLVIAVCTALGYMAIFYAFV